MKANPGGRIAPTEVIGRDELVSQIWRILDRQSVLIVSERRFGKTSIIDKMKNEAPSDKLPIYRDLEAVRTPLEFVELVFQNVEDYLSRRDRTMAHLRKLSQELMGAEIAGFKLPQALAPHWKALLCETIKDLIENKDKTVIFFWDEIPLMLQNIAKEEKNEAREILDTLRSLRHMHKDLRMVFTGSIGLHNVISSLKKTNYVNDPTNDMEIIEVPPLSKADAEELTRLLLEGEEIETLDEQNIIQAITIASSRIPYFIHHIVDSLVACNTINASIIDQIINEALTDPTDRWHFQNYRDRINVYYDEQECKFALAILDVLSVIDNPLTFDDLFNLLKSQLETEDKESVLDTLRLLQRDHYVKQERNGSYIFRFPLIQRFWRIHRGLGS